MARDSIYVPATLWEDEAFLDLTRAVQGTYLLIASQPAATPIGLLALTPRRWAGMTADATPEDIADDIRALDEAGFLAADFDTEELIVRRFGILIHCHTGPRHHTALVRAAVNGDVRSRRLRAAIFEDLRGFGIPVDIVLAGYLGLAGYPG